MKPTTHLLIIDPQNDCCDLPEAPAQPDALEARGRDALMVGPVHREMGTWGHEMHGDVSAACRAWETQQGRAAESVRKGENPGTEHIAAHRPGGRPQRIALDTDCTSSVGGFEAQHDAFFAQMRALALELITSTALRAR